MHSFAMEYRFAMVLVPIDPTFGKENKRVGKFCSSGFLSLNLINLPFSTVNVISPDPIDLLKVLEPKN